MIFKRQKIVKFKIMIEEIINTNRETYLSISITQKYILMNVYRDIFRHTN